MERRMLLVVLGAVAVTSLLPAQTDGYEKLLGVWRGQFQDLPAVVLTITDEGGRLSGAILFYLVKKSSSMSEPTTSTPGNPEPLLTLKFDGHALEFEVSHRRAHPPRTLSDPPAHFRLTLTAPDKAELVNETESSGPSVVLVRDK
jgi:hypothetical protein